MGPTSKKLPIFLGGPLLLSTQGGAIGIILIYLYTMLCGALWAISNIKLTAPAGADLRPRPDLRPQPLVVGDSQSSDGDA